MSARPLTVTPGRVTPTLVFLALACAGGVEAAPEGNGPRSREFHFTYQATVTGLRPGQVARVWLPVPSSDEDQEVSVVRQDLPAEGRTGKEPKYGNRILHVEARADGEGKVPLTLTYRVKRFEVAGDARSRGRDGEDPLKFLKPDARVPVGGRGLSLIEGRRLPDGQVVTARVLYDVVNGHMRYSKEGVGWGQGDADWACASGRGNCTDFHSLFIALARARKIPARFEIGFLLPERRGAGEVAGYHCWARFKPEGRGWMPVDVSEANRDPKRRDYYFGNLTEDRVVLSVGRDLTLVPKQEGPPLNFFVYPYVEVDGPPWPEDRVQRRFTFRDLDADGRPGPQSRDRQGAVGVTAP